MIQSVMTKRVKLLLKILIVLAVLALPVVILLKRADMIEFGGPTMVKFKYYNTLNKEEKLRRAEVWYKVGSYRNTFEIYTELLFGMKPMKVRHFDYGNMPIVDPQLPRVDLIFYRWCICLSKLNKRTEGMSACEQFLIVFPDSKYKNKVEKLQNELRARQL
ncbi:MAG: hypothetical protein GXP25_22685 [Planctomycetes bacterium]|nr:hypothetical protein [Planctomycetota bacterium]